MNLRTMLDHAIKNHDYKAEMLEQDLALIRYQLQTLVKLRDDIIKDTTKGGEMSTMLYLLKDAGVI